MNESEADMRKIAAVPALLTSGVLAAGLLAAAAGCGGQRSAAAGPGPDPGAPRATAPARCIPLKPGPGLPGPGPARVITVTQQDNGKTICVQAGTGILVVLHGRQGHLWSPVRPGSAVLQRRASGVMTLARGVTGGYFEATRLGSATLTSALTARCPVTDPTPASPGPGHCTARTVFRVTVLVRGRM